MKDQIFTKLSILEQKISKLIEQNFDYEQKIANFEEMLKEKDAQILVLKDEIADLKTKQEQWDIGKAFEGSSGEGNEEAKKKIDSLIKEINLCITALKE